MFAGCGFDKLDGENAMKGNNRCATAIFLVSMLLGCVFVNIIFHSFSFDRGADAKVESPDRPGIASEGSRSGFDSSHLYAYVYNSDGWVKEMNPDGTNIQNVLSLNNPPSCQLYGGACVSTCGDYVYTRGQNNDLVYWSTLNGNRFSRFPNVNMDGRTIGMDREFIYCLQDGCNNNVIKMDLNGNVVTTTSIQSHGNHPAYGFSVCNGYVWTEQSGSWWGWETDRFIGGNIGGPDVTWNHGNGRNIGGICFDGQKYYMSCRYELRVFDKNFNALATHSMPNYYWWIVMTPYLGVAFADDTYLKGPEYNPSGPGKVCYARYKPYVLSVNVTSARDLNEVSELKLYLDYNNTNATLCYNWSRQEFYKLQDPGGHVQMLLDNCTAANDCVERWWLNFTLLFNYTFPHRRYVDCFANVTVSSGESSIERFPWLFKVEKFLKFDGTAEFLGESQGKLVQRAWVKGEQNITVTNLSVIYANSILKYPDDEHFDVKVTDDHGEVWWDNSSSGGSISIRFRTGNLTDREAEYHITIVNIPGSGVCTTNLTIPFRIDADAPLPPMNLLCHAYDFKGKETKHTNEPEMYVTWDPVEDFESGLKGYYYSPFDGSATDNGSFITETQTDLTKLDEGYAPVYLWCIDNVGNIGVTASSGILVDMTPPGLFQSHSRKRCVAQRYRRGMFGGDIRRERIRGRW